MIFQVFHSIRLRKVSRHALASCCIAMLVLFTVTFLYDSAVNLLIISKLAEKNAENVADAQILIWQYLNPVSYVLQLLIGDTVVVWRAWVLLPDGKFWKILLAVLMMANIGMLQKF